MTGFFLRLIEAKGLIKISKYMPRRWRLVRDASIGSASKTIVDRNFISVTSHFFSFFESNFFDVIANFAKNAFCLRKLRSQLDLRCKKAMGDIDMLLGKTANITSVFFSSERSVNCALQMRRKALAFILNELCNFINIYARNVCYVIKLGFRYVIQRSVFILNIIRHGFFSFPIRDVIVLICASCAVLFWKGKKKLRNFVTFQHKICSISG